MKNNIEFYSQNGEDFLLWSLFKGKNQGFYIEIGAFDGIHFSNSYFFEKHGWKGVCVEAHPKYFSLCKNNRPDAICLQNACVGKHSGSTVTFHAKELDLFSDINTVPLEAINKNYVRRDAPLAGHTKFEVGAITLSEILLQYAPMNKTIEFVSIDTDGNELGILKEFNFQKWDIKIFVIEANDEGHTQPIIQLMQKNGYALSRIVSKTYLFARDRPSITYLRYKRISCQIGAGVHLPEKQVTKPNECGLKIEEMSRWITPNVLCQQSRQPLWSLLDYFTPIKTNKQLKSARIVHFVNPYSVRGESGYGKLQKLTYDSMRVASDFDGGDIMLVSVQHNAEKDLTPEGFHCSRFLDRTVTNLADFRKPQPLPLLFDILERGAELANPHDFLIYTNSDIILMPFFYSAVRDLIEQGFDAINICRRTIGENVLYQDRENLARSEVGETHPGSDCFVFSRKIFDKFIRNDACIGKEGVAKSLLLNLATAADRMLVLRNVNLTYHIGDDRDWTSPDAQDYAAFNRQELQKLYQQLSQIPERNHLLMAFVNTYWQAINIQG
jgi:FkbM family methyltransferase